MFKLDTGENLIILRMIKNLNGLPSHNPGILRDVRMDKTNICQECVRKG